MIKKLLQSTESKVEIYCGDHIGGTISFLYHGYYFATTGQFARAVDLVRDKLTTGVTELDMWDLCTSTAQWLLPRVQRFKSESQGMCPGDLTAEEWQHTIDEIIFALRSRCEFSYDVDSEYDDLADDLQLKFAARDRRRAGLKLLGEWLPAMWT